MTEIDEQVANLIMYHQTIHCENCEHHFVNGCGTTPEIIMECINR